MTTMVAKRDGVLQVPDVSKKWKMEGGTFCMVGIKDEYGERIIELVTYSEEDYTLPK